MLFTLQRMASYKRMPNCLLTRLLRIKILTLNLNTVFFCFCFLVFGSNERFGQNNSNTYYQASLELRAANCGQPSSQPQYMYTIKTCKLEQRFNKRGVLRMRSVDEVVKVVGKYRKMSQAHRAKTAQILLLALIKWPKKLK